MTKVYGKCSKCGGDTFRTCTCKDAPITDQPTDTKADPSTSDVKFNEPKRCRGCGGEFQPEDTMQQFCNDRCATYLVDYITHMHNLRLSEKEDALKELLWAVESGDVYHDDVDDHNAMCERKRNAITKAKEILK